MIDTKKTPTVGIGKVDSLVGEVLVKIKEKRLSSQQKDDFLILLSERLFTKTHPRIIRLDLKNLGKNFGQ